MAGKSFELNGHRLNVVEYGPRHAQPVVLLHHGLGAVASWRHQAPELAAAGYFGLVYDRWGYGKSDPRPALGIPEFVDDLADLEGLLDAHHIDQATLVGHSDGGTIALLFAAQHPQRVSAVAVIAAHVYVEPKMLPSVETVRAAFVSDPRFREGLYRQHREKTEAVFYNWYNGWARPENLSWDMRPVLAKVDCPALVVQGSEDEHARPQHAIDLAAALPQADLWLVPGARHMLPQENAAEFTPRLLSFLDQARQRPRQDAAQGHG